MSNKVESLFSMGMEVYSARCGGGCNLTGINDVGRGWWDWWCPV